MKFTDTHEWVQISSEEGVATVGVTSFVRKELGEIVYVELPEVGKTVQAGEEVAVLESTKAAADVYAPVSGVITAVNRELKAQAELINRSPENEGWLFRIAMSRPQEFETLLDCKSHE